MNTTLQQRIEEAAKKMSHNKMAFWEDCDYSTKDIEEIIYDACKLTAIFALQNQWISVSEALPQKDDLYFVLINNTHPRVTEFEQGKWQGYDNITHWMEIPKNT